MDILSPPPPIPEELATPPRPRSLRSALLRADAAAEPQEGDWLLEGRSFPQCFVRPPCWLAVSAVLAAAALALSCTVFAARLAALAGVTEHELVVSVLTFASIPIVSIAFTYLHIWLALWMTFFPIEFVGCWQLPWSNVGFPLGWQGIVPWKGQAMGRRACHLMTTHLVGVEEIIDRLEPTAMAMAGGAAFDRIADEAVRAAAAAAAPGLWAALPSWALAKVHEAARAATPRLIEEVVNEIKAQVGASVRALRKAEAAAAALRRSGRKVGTAAAAAASADGGSGVFFDLERLVCRVFVERPRLVSAMFIRCGWEELIFIRNTGAAMGGLLGLLQMGVYACYRGWWILPAFGLVAGTLTNYLALAMIFYPFHPLPLCPRCICGPSDRRLPPRCALHGLFYSRQPEVAAVYAKGIASAIVTPKRIIEELLSDGVTLRAICRERVLAATDLSSAAAGAGPEPPWIGFLRHALDGAVASQGGGGWEAARERAAEVVCSRLPESLMRCEEYMGRALALEETLRTRMAVLPPEQFEQLLHSVFAEDEWKLYCVGGFLGALLGTAQLFAFRYLGVS